MKITRVVWTPDGVYREPGDIIERDFVPDAYVMQEACGMEVYITQTDTEAEAAGNGMTGSVESPERTKEAKGIKAAMEAEGVSTGMKIGGRLEIPGLKEGGHPILVQEACTMTPRKVMRYFIEGKAQVAVKKTVDGERTIVENARDVCVGEAYEGKLIFSIGEKERILGLGQHEDGIANYRNCTQHLYQNNMQIPMPVFLSTAGYAVLLDADCLMVYEEKDNQITVTLDMVEQIAYYVIVGETMQDLVKGIRRITGKAAMLPKWAYGYIQSKERYKTQAEILHTAEEFGKRDIPVSCLVQDWHSWEEGKWGDKHLDKERYPDMKGLTDALHEKGIGLMISVWPNMNKGGADNQEMLEAGKLYANLSTYDAFDQEARELYWKQCERELFSGGVDAWWCDSTEPFTPDWGGAEKKTAQERYQITKGEQTRYMDARKANVYALYHAKGIHDNQRKAAPDRRIMNLTRSGYLSSQKYGAVLWSGDIAATWDVLRRQIVEGLNMAASGMPYWNLDIGAFFTGNLEAWKRWSGAKEGTQPWFWHGDFEDGVQDKGYCELYVRWLQYGTFLPVMRSHGTDTPREPWQFGEEGSVYYDTIVKYIRLRYHLVPYFYSLAYQVWKDDTMTMRSLLFDYPGDQKALQVEDEYLFGDFLVCPVTSPVEYGPQSTPLGLDQTRPVYLPAGNDWYDYNTKTYLPGGEKRCAPAPLDTMPLYVKAGSILAVDVSGETDLYHVQKSRKIGVEIYSGADGNFTCYFDNGDGYGYQEEEGAVMTLEWKEASRELTFSVVKGTYEYPQDWQITLYTPEGSRTKHASYNGEMMAVQF